MGRLEVPVVPKGRRNAILGRRGAGLRVAVTAAPEKGRANAAVEELLARALGIPPSSVTVVAGATARRKLVEVDGLDGAEALARLCPEDKTQV